MEYNEIDFFYWDKNYILTYLLTFGLGQKPVGRYLLKNTTGLFCFKKN